MEIRYFHEYRGQDSVFDNKGPVDIFVYHSPRTPASALISANGTIHHPRFLTYAVFFKHKEISIGYPILVSFDVSVTYTMKQVYDRVSQLIKDFINCKSKDTATNKNQNKSIPEQSFVIKAQWKSNGVTTTTKLAQKNKIFKLDEKNMTFLIIFNDLKYYKSELYVYSNRRRDVSAPALVDRVDTNKCVNLPKIVPLEDYIHMGEYANLFNKTTLFCTNCNQFKFINVKLDLWDYPNLLIVHLQRAR